MIAEGTGQAFAMNTGDELATITTTRTGQALTLEPGHALPI